MLQQMRDWFSYLKWMLVVVIFMFLVWAGASFTGAVFGFRGDRNDTWAAQVNGTQIEMQAFQRKARQLDNNYQSIFGEQYAQQRHLIRIGRQAMDQLVEEELLFQEASRRGLRVVPQEVAQAITRNPSFQQDGHFIGADRYRVLLKGNGVDIAMYEDSLRRGLLIQKYTQLVGAGAAVSDADVDAELLRRNRKTTVEYVLVDPKSVPAQAAPSDAETARYYEQHADHYRRGEGRTGIYVLLSPGEGAGSVEVTDAEIKAAYDRDLATRYTVREQRRASHILFKVPSGAPEKDVTRIETAARGVLKQAKAGSDFAALARAHSEDSTASAGGDLSFFGRGQMVKEFEDAAFSLPVGAVSDLVRTTYGFHIIKVTEARDARVMPLEEVRDRIREEIRTNRARAQALERAAALASAASGGKLETVARSQGLTVSNTGPVYQGGSLAELPASQPVVARMLQLQPGQVSDAISLASGQVVVQVTGTLPDEARPLAEVRDQVAREAREERERAAVGETIRSAGAGGLAALAKRFKTEVKTAADLTDGASLPGLPPNTAIEQQMASLQPGTVGEPIATASGILVMSVRERNDHKDLFEAQRDSTRDTLLQQQQDRLLRSVVHRLRQQGKVEINQTLVDSIDRS